jgi:hypothetical protein
VPTPAVNCYHHLTPRRRVSAFFSSSVLGPSNAASGIIPHVSASYCACTLTTIVLKALLLSICSISLLPLSLFPPVAMRRAVIPPSGRGEDAGPGAPAPATTPNTPRKGGAALNKLIRSLEDEFRLGLVYDEKLFSPSRRSDVLSGKVHGQIQRLYWKSEPALVEALRSFRQIAVGFAPEKRLEVLQGILKSQMKSPMLMTETPLSSHARPGNVPPKTLVSCELHRCLKNLMHSFYLLTRQDFRIKPALTSRLSPSLPASLTSFCPTLLPPYNSLALLSRSITLMLALYVTANKHSIRQLTRPGRSSN